MFPSEILDLIFNNLHDERTTLKACCVVSKSWVYCARRHIFAQVRFGQLGSSVESWMAASPDPPNSPAHHAHTLSISSLQAITAASLNARPSIRAFHQITSLNLTTFRWDDSQVSLVPLRGLSPTLKSLTIAHKSISPSEVIGLVCSFPSLEDLKLVSTAEGDTTEEWTIPSTSPKLFSCR